MDEIAGIDGERAQMQALQAYIDQMLAHLPTHQERIVPVSNHQNLPFDDVILKQTAISSTSKRSR
jgi:hypothetical protein